ncbi:biotin carboxylase N-terminal domain-containing protein [Nocardia fusca]|uniref:acetyl/propionyl/methylcrotonyl-CoA carboxylase subunit alpha n=1 Tax=Nocardia fusca TaxID=941183 RepID=UPI00379D554D
MRSVFIANRGEITSRIARTARTLGLRTVGVYSEPDAELPYLADVDEAVALSGFSPADTYLNMGALVSAATASHCDAVHPGYGFLSENAEFARAVESAGLTWVGPTPSSIEQMGSKVTAKQVARDVGVPVLTDAVLDGDHRPEDLEVAAASVGYPLLVKASAGGGGRGIRFVHNAEDLGAAVSSAAREAQSAFGDATLFLERYLAAPRHIEVQVFGDANGTVSHFGTRECSVQRRHQKLLEEAPAACLSVAQREAISSAAVRLASHINYIGAGTCEFLVEGDDFYFLEMNTRLQVEHTVTEEITGLDLVALQFLIAQGHPLPMTQQDIVLNGHAIQARICAENPAAGWLPSSGKVRRYDHPRANGLRYEDGIAAGVTISPHYDSMVTKVISSAADRLTAITKLTDALRNTALDGPETNVAALIRILEDSQYRRGDISVNWLEARPDLASPEVTCPVSGLAAALAWVLANTHYPVATATPGWSNTPRPPAIWQVRDDDGRERTVTYTPPNQKHESFPKFAIDDTAFALRILPSPGGANDTVRVQLDGRATTWSVNTTERVGGDEGGRVVVGGREGQVAFTIASRFADAAIAGTAGGPASPMPGTVLAVKVEPGEPVVAGQPLIVVEAMKMEHTIAAAADALVARVLVSVGDAVQTGQVLVEFESRG